MKIVDGINMEKVEPTELKGVVEAFNKLGFGSAVKIGVNPLGTVKAFIKAVESLDDAQQEKLSNKIVDYYNSITVSDEELATQQTAGKKKPEPKPKTEKKGDVRTVAEQHGVGKKPQKPAVAASKKDPDKPTKKSIVIAMVSKGKGATLDEMAAAMSDAGLGDVDQNRKTAKLWIPKIGFKVAFNEKTLRYSKE